uniref:ATP-dependent DNA helicase n=1 Tax=Nicotiana sylvestris TaxID=4096 RepID=A0A1U7XJY9_NICSY
MANEAKEAYFERNIIVGNEDLLLHRKLNTEQKIAYDIILQRVFANESGAFFIDGPGGSGKTFLYCALLATVRSKGFVALATTTSGVAASILPGGRTVHSLSMAKKNMIEALDSLVKDIMNTNVLFGGKVVVFGGDFRQTLHVVRSGKKEDFIRESILTPKYGTNLKNCSYQRIC